ncbi:cytochrome c [Thermoleophilia bacterium SCSIO 60948]|nr:cytochrome c [Thermoleophilia bacterium SCSIO 60948]
MPTTSTNDVLGLVPLAATGGLATVFYILGGVLVAAALITSFIGLRSERFPGSKRGVGLMLGTVAVVVVATGFIAIQVGAEELEKKEAEFAELEAERTAEGEPDVPDTGDEDELPGEPSSTIDEQTLEDGRTLFADAGCANCHALSDAGASAAVGPSLDSALQGEDEEFVRVSIVDPNAQVEQGYEPGVMPEDYEQQLSPEDLDTLVAYLTEVGGADGSGAKGDSGEVEGG